MPEPPSESGHLEARLHEEVAAAIDATSAAAASAHVAMATGYARRLKACAAETVAGEP